MKKKTNKNKTTETKPEDELWFELDGKVFMTEKKNGKVTERSELDGNLVLKCLLTCLTESIRLAERDLK